MPPGVAVGDGVVDVEGLGIGGVGITGVYNRFWSEMHNVIVDPGGANDGACKPTVLYGAPIGASPVSLGVGVPLGLAGGTISQPRAGWLVIGPPQYGCPSATVVTLNPAEVSVFLAVGSGLPITDGTFTALASDPIRAVGLGQLHFLPLSSGLIAANQ